MKLGAFSISLSVNDITASKEFYKKLGFTVFSGDIELKYLIMKNEGTVIGLFQDMFEGNMLTFNPGWDQDCNTLGNYTDVRELHTKLKNSNIKTFQETLGGNKGPGSFFIADPDGNTILIDQHVE